MTNLECIGGCGAELDPAENPMDQARGGLCAECWTLLDAAQSLRAQMEEPADVVADVIRKAGGRT